MTCQHEEFAAEVDVNRLHRVEGGPITHYSADVRIRCARCGVSFQFNGSPMGYSSYHPTTSVSREEMHLSISPPGHQPPAGLPGYSVRMPDVSDDKVRQ